MDKKVEVIRLTPLERGMRDLERVSRIGTAVFVGLALAQFVAAGAVLAGSDAGMGAFGHTDRSVLLQQMLIGAAFWSVVTIAMTLALNSGPRIVVMLFATLMGLFWLAVVSIGALAAAGALDSLRAAFEAGVWANWTMPFLGLMLGTREVLLLFGFVIAATLLIASEALWASVRGVGAAMRAPAATIKTLRGLRGLGPFSPSGLLATFDLPLALRDRRGIIGKAIAFVAILVATIACTFWLLAPLNVVVMLAGTAYYECYGGDPTDVEMGSCLLASAGPLGQFMILSIVAIVATCVLAALLMALAKRLLAGQLARQTSAAPIVFLRSFADDQARVKIPWRGPLDFLLDQGRSPDSVDQILVYEFGRYGPVKALGKPGERRPPFGAERIYSDHETWQQKISALIDAACAVVLVVDQSAGLRWELEQSLSRPGWLARTLFLLPSSNDFTRLQAAAGGGLEAPVLRRGEQVVAAVASETGWRLYVSGRPTRFTYQTMARLHFASLNEKARIA
jgi:hypothetical protein